MKKLILTTVPATAKNHAIGVEGSPLVVAHVLGHGYPAGKDWGEENDVTGTIGRSGGLKPIPLLIANSRSSGGGAIMTDCIVRILISSRVNRFQEVYRHPNYHNKFDTALILKSDLPEYSHMVVTQEGSLDIQARFHSEKSARNWLAFMRGERMSK